MTTLITGGTGFTGRYLSQRLLGAGAHVRLLVRDRARVLIEDGTAPEIMEGDIRDADIAQKAMRGVDTVFHVAAVYRKAGISNQTYWDVHVKGTENLLRASLENNIKRFIHCSTVGIHGHIEDPQADETYRFKPGDIYQITKLEGERIVHRFYNEFNMPCTIIRPCAIYGPGDMRLLKLFRLASKRIVPVLGSGEIVYHMVYIDDLVDGFILASESPNAVGEAFIVGGEERLSLNQLLGLISEVLGKRSRKIHLSPKPFQIAGDLCERICIPLGIEPPIYRRRVDFFTKSRSFDISKAKNRLGYRPKISLKEGLSRTAAWYRRQGLL